MANLSSSSHLSTDFFKLLVNRTCHSSRKHPQTLLKIACRSVSSTTTTFGFQSLRGTFTVEVTQAEGRPLNVPLISPFTIASSRLDKVENVAIRVELNNGGVGLGEAPILPSVTVENQTLALEKVRCVCKSLEKAQPKTLDLVLQDVNRLIPGHAFASVF